MIDLLEILYLIFCFAECVPLILWLIPARNPLKPKVMVYVSECKPIHALADVGYIPLLMALCTGAGYEIIRLIYYTFIADSPIEVDILVAHRGRLFLSLFGVFLLIIIFQLYWQVRHHLEHVIELEGQEVDRQVLTFVPPSVSTIDFHLKPYRWLFDPIFLNLEVIPKEKPLLFVGNHTILSFDTPLLIHHLYKEKNLYLRPLADHFHFHVPFWGTILHLLGAVDGTPRNCSLLMEAGQSILVYPGGAREVFKKKTDSKYSLHWKNRKGFARLAIKHGCTIVPVCSLGTEDIFDVVAEIPFGFLHSDKDLSLPIVKPPSPSQLQRVYFKFGDPIRTDTFQGVASEQNCNTVRDQTKKCIEDLLEELKVVQSKDPQRMTKERIIETVQLLTEKISPIINRRSEKDLKEAFIKNTKDTIKQTSAPAFVTEKSDEKETDQHAKETDQIMTNEDHSESKETE